MEVLWRADSLQYIPQYMVKTWKELICCEYVTHGERHSHRPCMFSTLEENFFVRKLTQPDKWKLKLAVNMRLQGALFSVIWVVIEDRATLYKKIIKSDCRECPIVSYSRISWRIEVKSYLHYDANARIWILIVRVAHVTAIHKRTMVGRDC